MFVIGNLDLGGAEKLVLNQVKNLDRSRFSPYLCTLFPFGANNYSATLNEIKDFTYVKFAFKGPFDILGWFKVYRFLQRGRFDVLCTHLFESNFIIRVINLVIGCRRVFVFEHNIYWKKPWWKIWADWFLAKQTSRIFVDSQAILDFTSRQERINKARFTILPYPIELADYPTTIDKPVLKRELGLPTDGLVVASVARFFEQKGQTYLIQAAKKLIDKNAVLNTTFLLVGYGPFEEQLKREVKDLNLTNKVIFSSPRDIKSVLPIIDIYVVPSLWEGQPIAMLEAMAACKTVVATKVGGIPEILVDGQNGLLAEPKSPDSLAEKISVLLADENLRHRLGVEAKQTVVAYSLPVYIRKLEEYFVS